MAHTITTRAMDISRPTAASKTTQTFLICGLVGGPLWLAVSLIQAFTRPGFDLSRHPLSALSLGNLGWLQITNFEIAGLLTIGFAIGIWRALHPGRAGTWGSILIGAAGIGMMAAGVFVIDPTNGFPPGTSSATSQISWHGGVHLLVSSMAFIALIAASFVHARRFAGIRQRAWAIYSVVCGAFFLQAFAGIATTGGKGPFTTNMVLGLLVMFTWTAMLAARLLRETSAHEQLSIG